MNWVKWWPWDAQLCRFWGKCSKINKIDNQCSFNYFIWFSNDENHNVSFLFLKQSLILSKGMLTLYRYEGQILTESIVVFCLVLCLPALDSWNLVIGRLTVVWDNFGKYLAPYTVLTACYITAILCIFCLLPAAINQKRPNPQDDSRVPANRRHRHQPAAGRQTNCQRAAVQGWIFVSFVIGKHKILFIYLGCLYWSYLYLCCISK